MDFPKGNETGTCPCLLLPRMEDEVKSQDAVGSGPSAPALPQNRTTLKVMTECLERLLKRARLPEAGKSNSYTFDKFVQFGKILITADNSAFERHKLGQNTLDHLEHSNVDDPTPPELRETSGQQTAARRKLRNGIAPSSTSTLTVAKRSVHLHAWCPSAPASL